MWSNGGMSKTNVLKTTPYTKYNLKRWMQSAQISSIGRHGTHSGLETNTNPHGWSRAGGMASGSVELDIYSWINKSLQDMLRLGNMRRHDVKGRSSTFVQLKSLAACCSKVYLRRHDVKGRSSTFAQLKYLAACCSEKFADFIIYLVYRRQAL